ncbi:ABC transporter ATP-binding protein [Catellatospora bangladeshensis]|uniref:Multidrug ABC transporter permease n=1 Tax=Catellatospora bangladeshensis TaxID=310355 RepID=A0A8J3J978_9ACTN|nr:ABC transporter ATP-binding protein [Catellatospora bangladeshensis]GIF80627.1 multidrug ABC transporter permease [Catellatospora bangladeshensis]
MTAPSVTVPQNAVTERRELLPVAGGRETLRALRALLRPRRGLAGAGLLVLTTATAIGLTVAPLLGHLVDLVSQGRPAGALTTPVVALAVVAVVSGALTAYGLTLVARLGEGALAELRERFLDRALRLPLGRVERAGSGDLTSRAGNDLSAVASVVRSGLPELGRSLLAIVLTLAGLGVLDWRLLLAALLAVPVQLHTVRWYAGRALPVYARQRVAVGAQQQQLLETIGGAATVRALRRRERHLDLVSGRSQEAVELTMRGVNLVTRFYARLNLAEFIGLGAVLVTGFLLVRAGEVSIGTATAAALYFHHLFTPINTALGLIDDVQAAYAALARLVGVAELPEPAAPPAPRSPADASLHADGVTHAYDADRPVLHDVSVAVPAGRRVALVGASGAGKSTLAGLVAGVHEPTAGRIRVGGVGLGDLDPAGRRAVALITQEVHVFAGTLAEDLRLAEPAAADEQLLAALDKVGAAEWVQALPDGLSTVVGEGGHRLTAAQAQQLALARLVLADPAVAVLDEATAEAGSAGARVLEASVAAALDGRTGLLVAHRLTQAALADQVVVLEGGRIVESGTHDELRAAPGGRYAELWRAWSGRRSG